MISLSNYTIKLRSYINNSLNDGTSYLDIYIKRIQKKKMEFLYVLYHTTVLCQKLFSGWHVGPVMWTDGRPGFIACSPQAGQSWSFTQFTKEITPNKTNQHI